eukprot:COSAG02_NODE_2116_length_9799_cov_3.886495_3_plen_610_part_00
MNNYYLHDYLAKKLHVREDTGLAPHAYSVADLAFRDLLTTKHDQAVFVGGESGAGKTEACKFMLEYLLSAQGSSRVKFSTVASKQRKQARNSSVSKLLADSEFVFEALGNASTLNNENSSRFVKYLNLRIGHDGTLLGATVHACLLERTRVSGLTSGKPFHVFRYLEEQNVPALRKIDRWLEQIGFMAMEVEAVHSILKAVTLFQKISISEDTGMLEPEGVPDGLLQALGCALPSSGRALFSEHFNAAVCADPKDADTSEAQGPRNPGRYKALHACHIRAGVERTSKVTGSLREGSIIEVLDKHQLDGPDGVIRLRFKKGWVTERASDGTLLVMPYTHAPATPASFTSHDKDQQYKRATTMRQTIAQSLYEGLFDTILQQLNTRIAYNPTFWNHSTLVCRQCKVKYILPSHVERDSVPRLCYYCHKRDGIPPAARCGSCGTTALAKSFAGKSSRCRFCRQLCCAECSLGSGPTPDVVAFAARQAVGIESNSREQDPSNDNFCYQCLADCAVPDAPDSNSLGILDIFGCERFEVNGLEQLCINYTNEKLHSVFLNEVFCLEKQLYQKEGLDLATVGVHFQVRTICNTTTTGTSLVPRCVSVSIRVFLMLP